MSEPRMVLAIFTNHYPFSPGEEFLESEVEILRKYFRLCIVPMSERGKLQSVPKGVETDYSLLGSIEKLSRKRMRRAVLGLSNLRFLGEKRTTIFSKRIYQMINYSALGTTILDSQLMHFELTKRGRRKWIEESLAEELRANWKK